MHARGQQIDVAENRFRTGVLQQILDLGRREMPVDWTVHAPGDAACMHHVEILGRVPHQHSERIAFANAEPVQATCEALTAVEQSVAGQQLLFECEISGHRQPPLAKLKRGLERAAARMHRVET